MSASSSFGGIVFFSLVCLCFYFEPVSSYGSGPSKIPLRNIDSLVFNRDSKTTGRRSSPIPQMQCTGGPCHLSPSSVFCKNIGLDANDGVNWECKASLPNGVTLGRVEVSCEGYDYPEDPYILKGSCGLEYTLDGATTTHNSYDSSYHNDHYRPHYSSSYSSSSFMSSIVSILVFLVIAFMIARACSPQSTHFRGGGGGSAWGPHDNPPPYGSGVYSSTASCAAPSSSAAAAAGGQGAGFWTGLGLGGLGGYFMGRNRNGYGMRYGNAYGGYGYGGGFGGGYRAPTYVPSGGGGSSSSSSYGGTRRR